MRRPIARSPPERSNTNGDDGGNQQRNSRRSGESKQDR